ncbi:hypothetical protein G3446_27295, partial [Thiorhodococcus minor]|nr:hypothetical protein [Thiorhodococcus minor]
VQQAMSRIRQLSADEEARRLAFVRERALHDEVSFLNEAKREGWVQGRQEALKEAEEQMLKTKRATARSLMAQTEMVDQLIAEIADLPVEEVKQLRAEIKR